MNKVSYKFKIDGIVMTFLNNDKEIESLYTTNNLSITDRYLLMKFLENEKTNKVLNNILENYKSTYNEDITIIKKLKEELQPYLMVDMI